MLLEPERNQIVAYGKKMIQQGLSKGTSGNISIFNPDENLMAISPSGIEYDKTRPEDTVVLDLMGNVCESSRKPSVEYAMHLVFYKKRNDIRSLVHAHSTFSTVLSCLGKELPPVHYMIALAGKNVRCAKYATFGTKDLADFSFTAMQNRKAVFLANHGLLAGGVDLSNAFKIAREVEYCAELYWRSLCVGQPNLLPDNEMERMKELFKSYGQFDT